MNPATRSLDILVGAIVSGATSLYGAFIGAVFIVFMPDWASEISPALGALIYGAFLIAVMLAANEGVVGLFARLLRIVFAGRAFACRPFEADGNSGRKGYDETLDISPIRGDCVLVGGEREHRGGGQVARD